MRLGYYQLNMFSTSLESKELPFTYTPEQVAGNIYSPQGNSEQTDIVEHDALELMSDYHDRVWSIRRLHGKIANKTIGTSFVNDYIAKGLDPTVPVAILLAKGGKLLESWSDVEKRSFLDLAITERQSQLLKSIEEQLRDRSYYPSLGNVDDNALSTSQQEMARLDVCKQHLRERVTPSDPRMRK